RLAAQLGALLAAAPDPSMALASWERLVDVTTDPSVVATLGAAELPALFVLLGSSQTLANTLRAAGDDWIALLRYAVAAEVRGGAAHAAALAADREPWEQFSERLRLLRHREYLRIGLADLIGRYDVETTMRELSALAEGLFAAA